MPANHLEASVRQERGGALLDLHGEINGFAQEALNAAYAEAEAKDPEAIILNFEEVDYIDSAGIVGLSVPFRVLMDGQPPGAAHGIDVDERGNGTVAEQRLYQLIRQQKPISDRLFEIEFLDSGVEAYCFTFG
jgi:hypothetical protein